MYDAFTTGEEKERKTKTEVEKQRRGRVERKGMEKGARRVWRHGDIGWRRTSNKIWKKEAIEEEEEKEEEEEEWKLNLYNGKKYNGKKK
jgi:hypothetical protein